MTVNKLMVIIELIFLIKRSNLYFFLNKGKDIFTDYLALVCFYKLKYIY